ncbi:amidohydrolase family protein [Salegentibacter sp. F188]|uniref:Amidohydrolase family protein n=1 Tax=Autumnicola patrickiae TaxID=3075591 RepID=A0ABU3E6B7_9FLAO|nr:amidohydrolase family protein [Salegentibacter sp. F188]MDT0691531.1 amidohydrolase family protein [Salegentibacter sp. F188]
MKIDAHQHFWHYDPEKYSWINDEKIQKDFLPEDLKPMLKDANFEGTILVQAQQTEEETQFLLKLAAENNLIKGVIGWVDLNSEEIEASLARFSKNKLLKGVRHTVYDEKGEFMTDPAFQSGVSKLAIFGLVYEILVFPYQLPGAIALAEKFPEQKFVLDHLAKPDVTKAPSTQWKQEIQKLAGNKNVFCKISGLLSEAGKDWNPSDFSPFLDVVVHCFGIERLMFGSDWPVSLSGGSYSESVKIIEDYFSTNSEEDLKKVMGGTACDFYNIS